jgi:hypothetical protein
MRSTHVRAAAFAGVVLAAVITLAGCTSGSSSSTDAGTMAAAEAAPDQFAGQTPGALEGSAPAGGSADRDSAAAGQPTGAKQLATVPVDGSKVIKTADLAVRLVVAPVPVTDDPTADATANGAARATAIATATTTVRGIAAAAGGFQASADGGGSQMTIGLRVPADQYDAVVDKIAALGQLTTRTESSQDVTAELVDVASRIDSMTASVARVRALLGQATNIADVISIESELATREADLESLQQQQASLTGRVAMSTVSLTLTAITDQPATTQPATDDSGFIAGLRGGWTALVAFFGWVGGALGAVLPFLPVLAVLGLAGWWIARRLRRRSARGGSAHGAPAGGGPAGGGPAGGREPAAATEPAPETAGVGSG